MSLINKMLQDLDARANKPGAAAVPMDTRPVQEPERRLPWLKAGIAVLALAAVAGLGTAGYIAWRMQTSTAVEIPVASTASGPNAGAVTLTPIPGDQRSGEFGAVAPAPARTEAPAAPAQPEAKPEAKPEPEPEPAKAAPAPPPPAAKPAPKPAPKPAARPAPRVAAPAQRKQPAAVKPAAGRTETAAQRAENGYRRALVSLEDGRVTEAIAHLQAALRIDPRHEASRQTLVGLLIEAKRHDEAMRQLQAALTLDARQPAMAMLLARLQVERGGPAIDTLMRTLPYAAGNGEYHAFLAGVLQREQRHREAAEHYQVALRAAPQNGVWWMGLGISLQADKRDVEAAAAYRRAQASGALSPELQTFVERKLRQLGR